MFFLTMAMAAAVAAKPAAVEAVPTVTSTHFLAMDGRNPTAEPVETTRIPHRPETSCYNWVIVVPPENRMLAVREVFELPAAAEQWNADPAGVTAVTADRTSAVTEFGDLLNDGLITHGWCVAEGDPVGPHRIRVFVGDRLLHEFRFEVVAESY